MCSKTNTWPSFERIFTCNMSLYVCICPALLQTVCKAVTHMSLYAQVAASPLLISQSIPLGLAHLQQRLPHQQCQSPLQAPMLHLPLMPNRTAWYSYFPPFQHSVWSCWTDNHHSNTCLSSMHAVARRHCADCHAKMLSFSPSILAQRLLRKQTPCACLAL